MTEIGHPELFQFSDVLDQFLRIAESTYEVKYNSLMHEWHLEKNIRVYETIVKSMSQVVASPWWIWAYYKEKGTFLFKASTVLDNSQPLEGLSLDFQSTMLKPLNKEQASLILRGDSLALAPLFSRLAQQFGYDGILLMPLRSPKQAELVGIVACGLSDHVVLNDQQIDILERFAIQAALAVDHARLVERLTTLEDVAASISQQANSLGVLRLILDKTLELPKFSTGQFYLADDVQEHLYLVEWQSEIGEKPRETIHFGKGVLGTVATTRTPRYIKDLGQYPPSELTDIGRRSGSAFTVPVLAGEELVGVLNIESAQAEAFTELDCYLISGFAKLASVVVWGFLRMMELAYISLQWASETHAWASSVSFISGASAALSDRLRKRKADGETIDLAERLAVRSHDSHSRLSDIHNVFDESYGLKSLLFKPRVRIEPISLDSMLKAILQDMAPTCTARHITTSFACQATLPEVNGVRALLNIAFRQILYNSLDELADSGGTISVELSLDNKNNIEVIISDNGKGIPSERRQEVFKPGYTTKPGHGGTGLSIAKYVFERHGGAISHPELQQPGTVCIVCLPSRRRALS